MKFFCSDERDTDDQKFNRNLQVAPQSNTFSPQASPVASHLGGNSKSLVRNSVKPVHSNIVHKDIPEIFQSIYYNPEAVDWITTRKLNRFETYQRLLALPGPTGSQHRKVEEPIDNDPNNLPVVLKTEWKLVSPRRAVGGDDPAEKLSNVVKLVSKSIPPDYSVNAQDLMSEVRIDLSNPENIDRKSCRKRISTENIPIYPLSCFFSRKVTHEDFLRTLSQPVINAMDRVDCSDICYLILVGVHIMSNEPPSWTWRTYWWTSEANPFDADGSVIRDKWSFFNAKATNSLDNFIANPYLEGKTPNGMRSNCINCHQYAAFSLEDRHANQVINQASRDVVPLPTDEVKNYFQETVQTHFLWTLAFDVKRRDDESRQAIPPKASSN